MAKLYYRYGAMNSGKTTALLQVCHNYEEQGMNVVIAKPKTDTKGADKLVSRIGLERKVDYLIDKDDDIYEYISNKKEPINCIIVDEAQFLEPIQVDHLMKVVVKLNIPVICYGLRLDFRGDGFPGSTRLLQLAHTIEEIKTICVCGRKAIFNARKINNKFVFEGDQVAIDGQNEVTYQSLCPHCFYKELEKEQQEKKEAEQEEKLEKIIADLTKKEYSAKAIAKTILAYEKGEDKDKILATLSQVLKKAKVEADYITSITN